VSRPTDPDKSAVGCSLSHSTRRQLANAHNWRSLGKPLAGKSAQLPASCCVKRLGVGPLNIETKIRLPCVLRWLPSACVSAQPFSPLRFSSLHLAQTCIDKTRPRSPPRSPRRRPQRIRDERRACSTRPEIRPTLSALPLPLDAASLLQLAAHLIGTAHSVSPPANPTGPWLTFPRRLRSWFTLPPTSANRLSFAARTRSVLRPVPPHVGNTPGCRESELSYPAPSSLVPGVFLLLAFTIIIKCGAQLGLGRIAKAQSRR